MKVLLLAIIIFNILFINVDSFSYSEFQLMDAIKKGRLKKANALLKINKKLNFIYNKGKYKNETPLKLAVKKNYHDMVRFFIKKGANTNFKDKDGATALCFVHDLRMAKLLVSNGAKINISIKKGYLKGWTALHFAVSKNQVKVSRYLLNKGANPTSLSNWGESPLHIAVSVGNVKLFKILYNKKLRNHLKGYYGNSIMHLVTEPSMAKLLKSLGFSIKKANKNKMLPIHLASELGELKMVQYFINAASPLNKKNKDGKTALDLTKSRKAARLLKRAGAKNSSK